MGVAQKPSKNLLGFSAEPLQTLIRVLRRPLEMAENPNLAKNPKTHHQYWRSAIQSFCYECFEFVYVFGGIGTAVTSGVTLGLLRLALNPRKP
jgi:hypothetical protein